MLNSVLIEQRLALMVGYLTELDKLARTPPEDFLADRIITGAAESYLRRSLEAIFDIGRHILAKTGSLSLATEYKAIARGLSQKGIVDRKLGLKLVEMAGYRNRLVHLYDEISDQELYDIMAHDLDDIRDFIRQIRNFLNPNTI
ncbi:MAG: type VII toxin-antitoxin system HepT family RNase toxin [Candidatus Desulforudaceae bacterium]